MTDLVGKTVLILEDEPILGLALEDMVIDAGGLPVYAASLEDAWETLARGNIDAAILDINLHGDLSYPIADDLRRLGVPFVFATGYGDALHGTRFEEAPTVTKPYRFAEILRGLDAAGLRVRGPS